MATYAICRIQKIKNWGELGSSSQHTTRERYTPNADDSVQNIRLIGASDVALETLFKDKIGAQTIRSNAVLGVEMLLSASPQYFRPDDPSQAGAYNKELVDEFAVASTNWLLERYQGNVVRAELHLDEATPHIHAYIVPIDNRNRLNSRAFFNGRQQLSEMQDSFADAVKHLRIERGVKGSKATHTSVKKYYAEVNQKSENINFEDLPQPTKNQNAFIYRDELKQALQSNLDTINSQLADRARILKEKGELAETALSSERERQKLEQRVKMLEQEVISLRTQAELLRDLPLDDVAYQLGLFLDKKGNNRWRGNNHIISIVDTKFYDFGTNQKGGGGAIDLVMHVNQCNFKDALQWLAERFNSQEIAKAVTHHIRTQTEEISKYNLTASNKFTPPGADNSHWREVQRYLTKSRKLSEPLIQVLHTNNLIYADKNANAVFIMRNLAGETTGAYLRGTIGKRNPFIGFAPDTKRTAGWFHLTIGGQSSDPITRAVLVKSPIEALSIASLMGNSEKTLYLAADSARSLPISESFRNIPTIIAAYDNDPAGDEISKQIKELIPHATRLRPKAKDWNEQLEKQTPTQTKKQKQLEH